jgi:tricarballylate dehydrogenase
MNDYDVIIVGAGNAALAAAVSAQENGAARVLVLEKAPREMRGGNTHWSGAVLRFAFDDPRELAPLLPDVEKEYENFYDGVTPYPRKDYLDDLLRVSGGQTDRALSGILVDNSKDTVFWMHEVGGVPMEPAITVAGVRKGNMVIWPRGLIVRAAHEGVGLSAAWFKTAEKRGIEIRYASAATELLLDGRGRVAGVKVRGADGLEDARAKAVVLGCGGFEANVQMRTQHIGPLVGTAKVRGTPHNQGDGLRMALAIGAMPWGQWSGCHATPISADWGDFAPRKYTDRSNRLSYHYGLMINRKGNRFVDEGEDQNLYTYAKFGRAILAQPGARGYQLFDRKVLHLLEPRYETSTPVVADTIKDLLAQLDIEDRAQALATVEAYNAAPRAEKAFDPTRKDGHSTRGLSLDKTNWATRLDQPPYHAYSVTGGITFTFGGLKINENAEVIGTDWRVLPGLHACGEMVGGLFYDNYPAGAGLVSGATFGRIAGRNAARLALAS